MKPDLANPNFEPSDEQLLELMKRAFANVEARHERARLQLQAQIEKQRQAALASLADGQRQK